MTAFRSVRESHDLWHEPEDFTTQFHFYNGHVWIVREKKEFADVAPPLVDCQRCFNMEIGELVYILEAFGPMAGTIRYQAAKTKLTPEQELRRMTSLWEFGTLMLELIQQRQ